MLMRAAEGQEGPDGVPPLSLEHFQPEWKCDAELKMLQIFVLTSGFTRRLTALCRDPL
jgi:hypothetical protein